MSEQVPLYPLAPLLFVAAVAIFLLQMARHLRVFAHARPTPVTGEPERRLVDFFVFSIVQIRMFKDLRAGLMHAAIFWGFVILTIGTANRVTFGLVETLLRWPLDGWLWRLALLGQNLLAVSVLGAIGYALFRRLISRPRRLTLSRD